MLCGLPWPSEVITNDAVRAPAADGVNVIFTWHAVLLRVAGLVGQLLAVIAKSEALVPVIAMLEIVTGSVPVVLYTVSPIAELELPTLMAVVKIIEGTLKVRTFVAVWPTPDSPTECGVP